MVMRDHTAGLDQHAAGRILDRLPLLQNSTMTAECGKRIGRGLVRIEVGEAACDLALQASRLGLLTRLQPFRLPGRAARQLPDQSTTLWVESSSTDDSRLRGALPRSD